MRVSVRELTASYPRFFRRELVLHDVSFTARAGEITAVVGPNGAGKTTLFRVLTGFLPPAGGHCTVEGMAPRDYRRRRGIGWLPENPELPKAWTGRDLLGRAADLTVEGKVRRKAFLQAVERTGLEERTLAKTVRKCSHGTRRRIWFGCALVGDPRLLVLDEPFQGLDPPSRRSLRREMRASRERGATVLVATHELEEATRLADRIVMLRDGRIAAVRELEEGKVRAGELEEEFFGGDAAALRGGDS